MSDEDKILGGQKWIPVYLVLFLILYLLVEGIDGLLSVGESFPGGQLFFFSCFGGAWGYTTALNDKTLCEFCDD